jgi:hypothetical protein
MSPAPATIDAPPFAFLGRGSPQEMLRPKSNVVHPAMELAFWKGFGLDRASMRRRLYRAITISQKKD